MSLKTLVFALATVAAGAVVAVPAAAATGDPSPARGAVMFWLLDRNGDGVIDQGEVAALRAAVFEALDLDHDGRLTQTEAAEAARAVRTRIADRLAAAIKAGPQAMMERRQLLAGRLGLDQPGGVAKADFVDKPMRLFAQADVNADGKISKDEFAVIMAGPVGVLLPE